MDTITVRNVSPTLRAALKAKARRVGCSLQEIVLEALEEKVQRETSEEWLLRVRENVERYGVPVDTEDVVKAIHEERGDPYP